LFDQLHPFLSDADIAADGRIVPPGNIELNSPTPRVLGDERVWTPSLDPGPGSFDSQIPKVLRGVQDLSPFLLTDQEIEGEGLLVYPRDVPLGFSGPSSVRPEESQASSHFVPVEDCWRIGFTPWDWYGRGHPIRDDYPYQEGNILDPYNQNFLKGDYPIAGQHTFLRLTLQTNPSSKDARCRLQRPPSKPLWIHSNPSSSVIPTNTSSHNRSSSRWTCFMVTPRSSPTTGGSKSPPCAI
jgi:hypothetical protein